MFCLFLVYDASGYYSGGMYGGNELRLNNPELCKNLNNEYQQLINAAPSTTTTNNENYNNKINILKNISLTTPPFYVQIVNAKYGGFIEEDKIFKLIIIKQIVCLPKSCTIMDLQQVMSYAYLPNIKNDLIFQNVELIDLRILKEKYSILKDVNFYIFW